MILLLCSLLAAAANHSAYVLRIDGRDAYFDLGKPAGAAPGERVKVFRLVTATNPVTQAAVQDRFLVAELDIAEAGDVLSRARPEPDVARLIKVGDLVELARPPAVASAASCPQPAPRDPEAEGFIEAFMKAQDLPVAQRAEYWERFASSHAAWAVSRSVKREIETLRQPPPAQAAAVIADAAPKQLPQFETPTLSAPGHALAGDTLEMVLAFAQTSPKAATLNYRPKGATLYRTVAFEADDAHVWRARLPDDAAQAPGVDYYVGVVDPEGAERAVAGTGAEPNAIDVVNPPGRDVALRKERSRASVWVDYANWNSKKDNDYHYNLEGEFLYRTLSGLHSIRMGFGLYQGRGQSLDDEKAGLPAQDVGYHYGFTELEFHPAELIGVAVKGLTGVDRDGFGAGVEGRLRIGYENGTNLVLASGFTKGIGNKNEITLTWDRVKGWPMAGSVIVTNEPVMADYGVRFIYSIGKSLGDVVDVSLRLSYELRNIEHGGFGVGIANSFHW